MLAAHEIFGFMSPALGLEIIGQTHATDKAVYNATLSAVANARKVRPVFLERKTREERNKDMLASICRPGLEMAALTVLQTWLLKSQTAMLADFLDVLGIRHENGAVGELPVEMSDERLNPAVEGLLKKYPHDKVAVYLRAFNDLNDTHWPNLTAMLDRDARLQLGVA